MQRVVKWTESYGFGWHGQLSHKEGYTNDLDNGTTRWFDLDPRALAASDAFLAEAFTRNGHWGRLVQHTHSVAGGHRIWTFVVEFPN